MVVNRSCSVDWPTKVIDLVSRGIHKPDLVSANAEEPFDAIPNRLPMVGRVVALAVAMVESSVGLATGAAVMAVGNQGRMTTVTTGGNGLKK